MRQALLMAGLLALSLAAGLARAAPAPAWTAFADCAAAYQANAKLSDPERSASMAAQISETANDYAKAATRAYGKRGGGRAGGRSADAVAARIAGQARAFAAQPRETVERFIDACPQLDD